MAYPNYKKKHKEEALFNPIEHINKDKLPKNFPEKYILLYDSDLVERIIKKFNPCKIEKFFAGGDLYLHKDIAIVRLTGIGCPHAVVLLEEAIAAGGKTFISIGTAGGLDKEGFFLCEKALRDEGTSYHYVSSRKFSYPDENLTDNLGKSLKKIGVNFERSSSWTIDAPYRETKKEIRKYTGKKISTVEMEASALFTVAKYRNVKIASAFVVSDILGKKWEQKFDHVNTKKGLDKLFTAAVDCLTK